MKNYQNLSILFWLYASKVSNRTGKAPIYARLTINGVRAEISIGVSIEPEYWNKMSGKAKGRGDDVKIVNHKIDAIRSKILYHYNHLLSIKKHVTAEDVKNDFLGIKEKEKTLLELVNYHNKKMDEKVQLGVMALGTLKKYRVTENKLEKFIKYQFKKSDLYLSQLKHQFVVDFEHFLRVKENVGNNTTMKYIKNLKKIMNIAVVNDWVVKNPFGNFKCSYHKVHKDVLNQNELRQIINKDFKLDRINEIKDVFIFSCFTGFSYAELSELSPDDIQIGLDGELWIYKNRKKTNVQEKVPLLPLPLKIIEKYKTHPVCRSENRLLPVKSNQKYNSTLKEIALLCKINKKLTTHTARHTFATTVLLANKVPMEVVKELLGHTDIRTTQIYGKILQDNITEEMKRLKAFYNDQDSLFNNLNASNYE